MIGLQYLGVSARLTAATCLIFNLVAVGILVPSPAYADRLRPARSDGVVRALAIGIDRYKHPDVMPTLEGAVADATDIAAAVRKSGSADVTLLLDAQVTRAAVTRSMQDLIARTRFGDLVVVSFAGHGTQDIEQVAGSEPDGLDEYFVLHGFGPDGGGERIVDDQMFDWLKSLSDKGAGVIFLADSCHGGGMTKASDPRAGRLSVRGVKRVTRAAEAGPGHYFIEGLDGITGELRQRQWQADEQAAAQIPGLLFIGAVDAKTLTPELAIGGEGTLRGAASYALARALSGAAADREGRTTRHALMTYIQDLVRTLSLERQTPVTEPWRREAAGDVLFRHDRARPATAAASIGNRPHPGARPIVTAKPETVVPGAFLPPSWLTQSERGARRPAGPEKVLETPAGHGVERGEAGASHLLFDARSGDLLTPSGDVLAYAVAREGLQAAVDRFRAHGELAALAARNPLALAISPRGRALADGEAFAITAGGLYGRHVILANITGNGVLQLLNPPGTLAPLAREDQMTFRFEASPPFGSDTFVVIASAARLAEMELELALLARTTPPRPLELAGILERHLGAGDAIGVLTYATAPGIRR